MSKVQTARPAQESQRPARLSPELSEFLSLMTALENHLSEPGTADIPNR